MPTCISELFKNLKFFCFSPTKDLNDKVIKERILKEIELNGGTAQYCIQKFSTNYIIVCNSLNNYDRNENYYSLQLNVLANVEKSKSYNLNLISYKFIYDCLEQNKIITDLSKYIISNITDDNTVIKIDITPKIITPTTTIKTKVNNSLNYDKSYLSNSILSKKYNINQTLNQKKQEKQEQKQFQIDTEQNEIYDLFDFDEEKESINNELFGLFEINDDDEVEDEKQDEKQKKLKEDKEKENEEEEEEEEEEEPKEEEYDLFEINYYEDVPMVDSQKFLKPKEGYIFQFISNNISLYHEKDFPNGKKPISQFQQSSKGLSCMITSDKKCYSWGNITSSQLVDQQQQQQQRKNYYNVQHCSVGSTHALMINDMIYSIGTNKFGQLGNQGKNIIQSNFTIIDQPLNFQLSKKVKMVSCGKDFSMLLTNDHKAFSWGKNDKGQLGLGFKCNNIRTTIGKVEFNNNTDFAVSNTTTTKYYISNISCGFSHTVATASHINSSYEDKLYCWGSNGFGQIISNYSDSPIPLKHYCTSSKTKVFCYQDSTWIIDYPFHIAAYGEHSDLFKTNLHSHLHNDNSFDYNLVQLKKNAGILVFDNYLKVRFLIRSINYSLKYHYEIIKSLIKTDGLNVENATLLVQDCCEFGNLDVFKLLENKFKGKLINSFKECPFHIASSLEGIQGPKIIAKYCIDHKLYSIDHLTTTDYTPLHFCSLSGNYEMASILLLAGCKRDIKNHQGQTPLHLSVSNGANNGHQMASLLCKHGAQSLPDKKMKTPLQYCGTDVKSTLQSIIHTNEVFISYAHRDSEFVQKLRSNFGLFSLRCWLDEYRLQAGCNWRAEITKGVENSNVIVFVVSETSINSLWCRKELKMSKKLGKIIIPLFLQDIQVDPILFGLFSLVPNHSKPSFNKMSETEVIENVSKVSNIIHSILINGDRKLLLNTQQESLPLLTHKQLFDKWYSNNKNSCTFLLFSPPDRLLFDYLCEKFKECGIPTTSSDDIIGRPSDDQDPYSLANKLKTKKLQDKQRKIDQENEKQLKKELDEKAKQQWKLTRKVEKKLEKSKLLPTDPTYQYLENYYTQLYKIQKNDINDNDYDNNNNHQQQQQQQFDSIFDKEVEIPILNNIVTVESLDYSIQNQSVFYDDGITSEEDFYKNLIIDQDNQKYSSIKPLREYIENSLLMVLLFTNKSTLVDIQDYCLQVEYAKYKQQGKTIIVITNNLSLRDNESTPSIIKDLVWYKIDIKNIDDIFENITLIYEVLEKTLQVSNLIKKLESNK